MSMVIHTKLRLKNIRIDSNIRVNLKYKINYFTVFKNSQLRLNTFTTEYYEKTQFSFMLKKQRAEYL